MVGTERGMASGMKRGRAPQRAALLLAAIFAMLLLGGSCAIAAADEAGESTDSAPASAPLAAPGPELEGERTATSQTFLLPDGALETRLYGSPVNYQDPEGDWKPIDEGFEELDNGRLTNGPNSFDISLPERLGEDPVRLGIDGAWVTTELLGAEPEAVQPEDATATYDSVGNGADFEFANLADGLKEEIVLADPSQPSTFNFELDASNGLTPVMREDGSIQFRDANGQGVVTLPAPVMSDSAEPTPETSRDIHYTLGPEVDGHWKLTVEADRDWLTQPDRSWPVRLDPTMTIGSDLDCIIGGSKGQTGWIDCSAWGRKVDLVNYTPSIESSKDGWQRGLLYLETSALPANATVSSATFNIYSAEAAVNTSGAELLKTSKPWTWEASWSQYAGPSKLWTTEGGDTSESLGQVLTSQRGSQAGWWQFTVPAKTVEAEAAKAADLGTLLKLIDDKTRVCGPTSCTQRSIAFNSSAATDTTKRPYLSVVYTVPTAPTVAERRRQSQWRRNHLPIRIRHDHGLRQSRASDRESDRFGQNGSGGSGALDRPHVEHHLSLPHYGHELAWEKRERRQNPHDPKTAARDDRKRDRRQSERSDPARQHQSERLGDDVSIRIRADHELWHGQSDDPSLDRQRQQPRRGQPPDRRPHGSLHLPLPGQSHQRSGSRLWRR